MKVALLLPILYGGGSERVASVLSNALINEKCEVYIIATSKQEKNSSYFFNRNAHINLLNANGDVKRSKKIQLLRNFYRNNKIDYAISFANGTAVISALGSKGTKTIPIYYVNSDPFDPDIGKFQTLLFSIAINLSKHVVFQSEKLRKKYSLSVQNKSTVIENPIDVSSLPQPFIHSKNGKFISAGRLCSVKNFPFLISSFVKFHEIEENSILEIYGSGPDKKIIEELIGSLNASNFIKLYPYTTDIFEKMAESSCFLLVSKHEGMPNVILESQCLGLPAVALDAPIGGISDLVCNGWSGLLSNPLYGEDDFVAALSTLYNHYEHFAQGAYEHAFLMREAYSASSIAKKWLSLLKKIA